MYLSHLSEMDYVTATFFSSFCALTAPTFPCLYLVPSPLLLPLTQMKAMAQQNMHTAHYSSTWASGEKKGLSSNC